MVAQAAKTKVRLAFGAVVALTVTGCGGGQDSAEDPYPSSLTTAEAIEDDVQFRPIPATCLVEPSGDGLTAEQVQEAQETDSDLVAPWLAGQDDQNLEEALQTAVQGAQGDLDTDIGVVVLNRSTGEQLQINQDSRVQAASLSKVSVALSFMRHLKETDEELTPVDSGLLEDSLANSGNESTAALFERLGEDDQMATDYLTETYRMLGATETTLQLGWGTESTTAADLSAVLDALTDTPDWVRAQDMDVIREYLDPAQGYDSYTQDFGVGVLARADRVPPELDVQEVAVKNGWLPGDDDRWNVGTMGQATINGEVHDIVITTYGAPNAECGYALLDDLVLMTARKAS
ncbi:serine hydrolase [Kocuria sp.]|uniref:serine hydrolase n=1 Tax=Kocuria sp. TaxID=1871328 RepID=UPI0026DFE6AB|nr:serine hydrolase [Kocuria sp.]MDO5618938.1 hypothetical protein [Kocuria sp.]